jgi:multiple sugar transport system substrate-binding protein
MTKPDQQAVMARTFGSLRGTVRWVSRRRRAWFAIGVVIGMVIGMWTAGRIPAFWGDQELEHGELVILSGRDDSVGGQRQKLIDQWNKEHPDSHARIEELSSDADAQHSQMVAVAQSGEQTVDVYNLDVTWVAEFAAAHYIRPLDESVDTDGFLDNPLRTCHYSGKLWALPFNTDAGLLFYRTDLVTKPELPGALPPSRDEVAPLFRKTSPPEAGYVGQYRDYEGLTVNALEAIWSAGGEVLNSSGQVAIDSREARNGLNRLAAALADPKVVLNGWGESDESKSTDAFRKGRVAFMRNWPVQYGQVKFPNDASQTTAGSPANSPPFAVSELPGPSVLGGQNLAIAADTRKPRAAQELIEFLTSEESQKQLFEHGGFAAARESVYHDSDVKQENPYAETLLDAIRHARRRPETAHYTLFSQVFRDVVNDALRDGGKLPQDATSRLTDALKGQRR